MQGQVVKSNGAGQLKRFTDLSDHKKEVGKVPLTDSSSTSGL